MTRSYHINAPALSENAGSRRSMANAWYYYTVCRVLVRVGDDCYNTSVKTNDVHRQSIIALLKTPPMAGTTKTKIPYHPRSRPFQLLKCYFSCAWRGSIAAETATYLRTCGVCTYTLTVTVREFHVESTQQGGVNVLAHFPFTLRMYCSICGIWYLFVYLVELFEHYYISCTLRHQLQHAVVLSMSAAYSPILVRNVM